MRIAKKLAPMLMVVTVLTLSLPANIVQAVATTVEVNNGNTLTLNANQVITASGTSGIPVAVKGLPDLGPGNGLATFDFSFSWNKNIINVDSVNASMAASSAGWTILRGTPDNVNGRVKAAGFRTNYDTNDIILLYLGITAKGNAVAPTSINITITTLGDKDGKPIAATPVNASIKTLALTLVSIELAPTNPSIALGLTQQFTATGILDDKSSIDITGMATWASSNPSVATIGLNTGLAASLAQGTISITATWGSTNGTTTLTVTKAEGETTTPPPEGEVATPPAEGAATTPPSGGEKSGTTAPSAEEKTATTLPPVAAPSPPAVTPRAINWRLISGITAGVVLLGLVSYFLVRRRAARF